MKLEKFEKRLVDTMHWCHSEMVDYHVRTKMPGSQFFQHLNSLQPPSMAELKKFIEQTAHVRGSVLRRFAPEEMGQLLKLDNGELDSQVSKVSVQRAEAVIQSSHDQTESIAMSKGRLLCFEPGSSVRDGKAMLASGGYFDVEGFPPSDTWIAYVVEKQNLNDLTGYLLAWVPSPVEPLVEKAMKATATDCLHWAADMKTTFLDRVRARMGYTI